MPRSKRAIQILLAVPTQDLTRGPVRHSDQIWDPRQKHAADFVETDFPVTAVALSEAGNELYSGGIDNDVKVWDLRKKAVAYSMIGHGDTVTSLEVSPDAQSLLSNSMDCTARTWDIRPFAPVDRHVKTYDGATAGLEKNLIRASWDAKGDRIAAGSEDRSVVVWDTRTAKLLYKLPGHKGSVNDVRFHPGSEPISGFFFLLLFLLLPPSSLPSFLPSLSCLSPSLSLDSDALRALYLFHLYARSTLHGNPVHNAHSPHKPHIPFSLLPLAFLLRPASFFLLPCHSI